MAVIAADLAIQDLMRVRQRELDAVVHMATEARLGVVLRVDDRIAGAGLDVLGQIALGGLCTAVARQQHIWHDALGLDRSVIRRVITRGGELEGIPVVETDDVLHRTLAETAAADDGGALVVLQGAGQDFGDRKSVV